MFESIGPALVAAGNKRSDRGERRDHIMAAGDMRGICVGGDQDEIVPGDLAPLVTAAGGDELLLRLGVVYQYEICVTARRRC